MAHSGSEAGQSHNPQPWMQALVMPSLYTTFTSEKQEGLGCHFLQGPVTLLPKHLVENASHICSGCGQYPVGKGQLAVQSGKEFFVRPPFSALINKGICTAQWGLLGTHSLLLLWLLMWLVFWPFKFKNHIFCNSRSHICSF